MNPSDAFGHDYPKARRLFLEAAETAGARITSFRNPHPGPEGMELFSDLAWFGSPEPKRVLFTMSGTHGIEGITGSGIQINSLQSGLARDLPEDTAVVLLHALTAHGFAWLRRCNEDGVDVCRNFVDFDSPPPPSDFYREFARDIVPEQWSGSLRESADERLFGWAGEHGIDRFTAELARGQYEYDFAPFYGGDAPTWSNRLLREIFSTRLSGVRRLFLIDYHTGLGERGTGQLLGLDHPSDPIGENGRAIYGEKFVSIASGESVAYEVTGDIAVSLAEHLTSADVVAAAYEFGTLDAVSVFQALRGDHWLHAHGDLDSAEGAEIKDQIRSAFYCEDPVWHREVSEQAIVAEREALAALR